MNGTTKQPSSAQRDPAEGSRDVIDHELRRSEKKRPEGRDGKPGQRDIKKGRPAKD